MLPLFCVFLDQLLTVHVFMLESELESGVCVGGWGIRR